MPLRQPEQGNVLQSVESYFTDAEPARNLFSSLLTVPSLQKRLLIIHGLGGVGKSSLLQMFRLDCKEAHVPTALASGNDAKSAVEVLAYWAEDLKADRAKLPRFTKTYEHYRIIQVKIDEELKKEQKSHSKTTEMLGKTASKTAEATAGAVIGAAVGSAVPGAGTLAGALGGAIIGTTSEELMDFLQSFLTKTAIDLLLDPAKKITDDFLKDIASISSRRRLVLMVDTFEQMTGLDPWLCKTAQRLPPNVLLVVAGREMVNWDRQWPGWLAAANVQRLEPMTPEIMRALIHNYYATQVGNMPDPEQVAKIIRFARGLPIAVTTAVRLWVKYRMDFDEVRGEALHELVKRLMEGVATEMIPALMAAAALRYFNKEILRAVMKKAEINALYDEIRHFPFVFSSKEGLRLHDSMRELLADSQEMDDREQHCELHERAAMYFEEKLKNTTGEEADRIELEYLYHRLLANEETGIKLFQKMAEELVRYRLINRLRDILSDVDTYPLRRDNSKLWREYYNARLAHLETQLADAEKIYCLIGNNELADPKLRAYALCDWGEIWTRYERLSQVDGIQKAIDILERGRNIAPQLDSKLIFILHHLRIIYIFKSDWDKALPLVQRQRLFFQEQGDMYGVVFSYSIMKIIYGLQGDWKGALAAHTQGLSELSLMPASPFLQVRLKGFYSWVLLCCGRCNEVEQGLRESLSFVKKSRNVELAASLAQDLGYALGLQRKYQEAAHYFSEGLKSVEHLGKEYVRLKGIGLGFWGKVLTLQGEGNEAEKSLKESLNIKREIQDNLGMPEILNKLGELNEIRQDWLQAESYYQQSLSMRKVGRHYYQCEALTGLLRVKDKQSNYTAIPSLLMEAEQLAQQYEYNDCLASIRLTQGHMVWNSSSCDSKIAFDVALCYYQQALIFGLRFNRFLLDEVLSGWSQWAPFQPIIPHCLQLGARGRKMLGDLRDWWQAGINDIGEARSETISPIAENLPLLDAEQIARKCEPGDGLPQLTVIEQIEKVLFTE